jgi:NADH-quinone oxidoreductase subunit D
VERLTAIARAQGALDVSGAPEGFDVPAGEVYQPIEGSKGELGVYIKSTGGPKPARVHFRGPSFVNLSALPHMSHGAMVADIVAIIGSLDIVLGEIDR